MEEIRKDTDNQRVEIDEEMLDFVAGGVYSQEEWAAMSVEERMEAWRISKINRLKHVYCQLD